ncbi:hypothetical protein D3C84_467970 [compost metagenome]
MQAMESGQDEEGIAVDAGVQSQPQIPVRMQVFIALQPEERQPEHHGHKQHPLEATAFAILQAGMCKQQGD